MYPIEDDQQFFMELLQETKVMLVQGTGFNWGQPDHFRIVFLPHEDDLREAIGRIARFLELYRKRHAIPARRPDQAGRSPRLIGGRTHSFVLNFNDHETHPSRPAGHRHRRQRHLQCPQRNQEEIRRRAGRGIEITMVADLDVARAQAGRPGCAGGQRCARRDCQPGHRHRHRIDRWLWHCTPAGDGGHRGGKHVVTANKALLAVHGTEIFAAAHAKGVMVAFEAAVAGGIPIIKALREGLTANSIQWIAGIINGTTNFILSEMRDKGLDFAVVLKEAQRLGYAEADPTFDIEGVDAAHKATIMSAIAFGIPVQFDKAYVEGITKLTAQDIQYAEQLGYRIKLLGITKRSVDSSRCPAWHRAARASQPGAHEAPDRQRRRAP
jgi:homoserine dehydrogenase